MRLRFLVMSVLLIWSLGSLQYGCAPPVTLEPASEAVVQEPPRVKPAPKKTPAPGPVVTVPKPVRNIAILVSNNSDRFSALADILVQGISQPVEIHRLPIPETAMFTDDTIFISIGDQATGYLVRRDLGRSSIFTIVFDAENQKLLDKGFAGISPYPPPARTLAVLQQIAPDSHIITIPHSPASARFAQEVTLTAEKKGMQTNTQFITTDKELSFLARELSAKESTFWMLPDNSILSRQAIFDTMSANLKKSRRTIVFDPALFKLGGLISSRYSDKGVADATISLIDRINRGEDVTGLYLQPENGDIQINAKQAQTLGLTIPEALQSLTVY